MQKHGDAMRLPLARRPGHAVGERHQLLEQLGVLRRRQRGEIQLAPDRIRVPLRGPEDAAQPGVRHLHVEDRVLVGLLLGQLDIEVERARAFRARKK